MVDGKEMADELPGGRGSTSDAVDSILQKNMAAFGPWIDSYAGKAAFVEKLKMDQEDTPLTDWIKSVFTDHKGEDMNLSWSDIEDDDKGKLLELFQNEKEVWKWMCNTPAEK